MRRILSVSWVVAALACSSVEDKQACSASTDCPAGQYCAHAEGESRCWADASAPTVDAVTASCAATPCLRDGVLHVEATITDDAEVLDASVSLDLPSGGPVPMTRTGNTWVADVQLRGFSFPAYARDVVATVTARDGARNPSNALDATGVGVTRLRWTHDAGAPITSPAVMDDGTAVVGVSASSGQVLAVWAADGTKRWSVNVGGTAFVSAAPAIGDRAIWVGSEDFSLYGVALDGSGVIPGIGVATEGAIKGSVAILSQATKEWGFVTSASGRLSAGSTVVNEDARTALGDAYLAGPVVGADGRVYTATATSTAKLRAFSFDGAFTPNWVTDVGVSVSAPLAVDGEGNIWTGSQDAKLVKTTPADLSGTAVTIRTLPGSIVDSPALLANGDIVVGDQSGVLHRYTSTGSQVWSTEPNLAAPVHAATVLAAGDASFIVPTAGGRLFALRGDGSEIWSATLDTGNALRPGNIYTPPGQTANVMSTAYVASSSGRLFAVVVDGELDASAPWPKAFHDPRNTNRAGPQP